MYFVLRKNPTENPTDAAWTFITVFHHEDDLSNDRLDSLGPGEFKVLHIDPDKAVDVAKKSDPLIRHREVPVPKPPKGKDLA